jgi:hypothetical protein
VWRVDAWPHRHHHTAGGSSASEPNWDKSDSKYCVYDAAHKDYLYTEAWVDKLVKDLADASEFQLIIGAAPGAK